MRKPVAGEAENIILQISLAGQDEVVAQLAGIGEAGANAFDRLTHQFGHGAEIFGGILAGITGIGIAFSEWARRSSEATNDTQALGASAGMTISQISGLQTVLAGMGADAQTLSFGFRRLAFTIQNEWQSIVQAYKQSSDVAINDNLAVIASVGDVAKAHENLRNTLNNGVSVDPGAEAVQKLRDAYLGVAEAEQKAVEARKKQREDQRNDINNLREAVGNVIKGQTDVHGTGDFVNLNLTNTIRGIIANAGPATEALKNFSGSYQNIIDQAPEVKQVLFDLMDFMKNSGDPALNLAVGVRLLGRSFSQDMAQAFSRGSEHAKELEAELEKLGLTLNKSLDNKPAQQFVNAFGTLSRDLITTITQIGDRFVSPAFTLGFKSLDQALRNSHQQILDFGEAVAKRVNPVILDFFRILTGAQPQLDWMRGVQTVLLGLKSAFVSVGEFAADFFRVLDGQQPRNFPWVSQLVAGLREVKQDIQGMFSALQGLTAKFNETFGTNLSTGMFAALAALALKLAAPFAQMGITAATSFVASFTAAFGAALAKAVLGDAIIAALAAVDWPVVLGGLIVAGILAAIGVMGVHFSKEKTTDITPPKHSDDPLQERVNQSNYVARLQKARTETDAQIEQTKKNIAAGEETGYGGAGLQFSPLDPFGDTTVVKLKAQLSDLEKKRDLIKEQLDKAQNELLETQRKSIEDLPLKRIIDADLDQIKKLPQTYDYVTAELLRRHAVQEDEEGRSTSQAHRLLQEHPAGFQAPGPTAEQEAAARARAEQERSIQLAGARESVDQAHVTTENYRAQISVISPAAQASQDAHTAELAAQSADLQLELFEAQHDPDPNSRAVRNVREEMDSLRREQLIDAAERAHQQADIAARKSTEDPELKLAALEAQEKEAELKLKDLTQEKYIITPPKPGDDYESRLGETVTHTEARRKAEDRALGIHTAEQADDRQRQGLPPLLSVVDAVNHLVRSIGDISQPKSVGEGGPLSALQTTAEGKTFVPSVLQALIGRSKEESQARGPESLLGALDKLQTIGQRSVELLQNIAENTAHAIMGGGSSNSDSGAGATTNSLLAQIASSAAIIAENTAATALYFTGPKEHAGGGHIVGPGGNKADRVPILASNDEYMMQADAVHHYGLRFMDDVNNRRFSLGGLIERFSGALPRFSAGGFVGGLSSALLASPQLNLANGSALNLPRPTFAHRDNSVRDLRPEHDADVAAHGSNPFTLVIGDRVISGLTASDDALSKLSEASIERQIRSGGRKPTWYRG